MADKPWIYEGATVAVRSGGGASSKYDLRKIARFTDTQIVLDNGVKYRRDDLHQVGNRYASELMDPADPGALRGLAGQRVATLRYEIDRAFRDLASAQGPQYPAAVIDAIAGLTERARQDIMALYRPK